MSGTFRQRPGWPGTGRPTSVAGTRTGLPGRGPGGRPTSTGRPAEREGGSAACCSSALSRGGRRSGPGRRRVALAGPRAREGLPGRGSRHPSFSEQPDSVLTPRVPQGLARKQRSASAGMIPPSARRPWGRKTVAFLATQRWGAPERVYTRERIRLSSLKAKFRTLAPAGPADGVGRAPLLRGHSARHTGVRSPCRTPDPDTG